VDKMNEINYVPMFVNVEATHPLVGEAAHSPHIEGNEDHNTYNASDDEKESPMHNCSPDGEDLELDNVQSHLSPLDAVKDVYHAHCLFLHNI
jgi:hypothetical protein